MEPANGLKVIGATGAATGLNARGTFVPPTLDEAFQPNSPARPLVLRARDGKKRKLSPGCKQLLRLLPG